VSNKVVVSKMVDIPADIEQSIQVNGEHMVALVVAQAEEQMSARQDVLRGEINDLTDEYKQISEKITKETDSIRKSLVAEAEKTFAPAFKKVGVKVTTSCSPFFQPVQQDGKYTVTISVPAQQSNDAKAIKCAGNISFQRSFSDQKLAAMGKTLAEVQEKMDKKRAELAKVLAFGQDGIGRLERWAKGQLALNVIKKSGDGNVKKFMEQLVKVMPESFQKVLT